MKKLLILLAALLVLSVSATAQNRLKDRPTASSPAADDWLYLDGTVNGVRKLSPLWYQPLDADLTALAALSGTNTIYYRSAANTWTAVTIGSGLTFSGGSLAATGGGGGTWGSITGTLSAQTDLQTALDAKLASATAASTYQPLDSDLTYLSGFTPTANVKSVLNAADYAAIRTLLTLVIGTNVQAYDADLTTYAGITPSANVQSVLSAADYAAIRTLLTLVIGTNVQAYDADLTTYAGITPSANVQSVLSAADYAAIRTLLALTIGTNVQAYDADLTTWAGITPSANVQSLNAAADYAAIRTLLTLVIGTNVQAYDADLTTWAGITPSANVQSLNAAADYAAIRTLLTLVIGTNVQAYDADLAALAGLTSAADKLPYFTGSGTAAVTDLTSTARTLLDDSSTGAMLTTLGTIAEKWDGTFDGGGATVPTGQIVYRRVKTTGDITAASVVGDVSGAVTLTVKKYTPSGGALGSPTTLGTFALASTQEDSDTGLTWAVTAGDVLSIETGGTIISVTRLNWTLSR